METPTQLQSYPFSWCRTCGPMGITESDIMRMMHKLSVVVRGTKWLFQELTAIKVIDVVLSSSILFPGRGTCVSG